MPDETKISSSESPQALLAVQGRGGLGSHLVAGSTGHSRSDCRVGPVSTVRLRPPPGLRPRSICGATGFYGSSVPCATVSVSPIVSACADDGSSATRASRQLRERGQNRDAIAHHPYVSGQPCASHVNPPYVAQGQSLCLPWQIDAPIPKKK